MPVAHDPARIGSTATPFGYPPFVPYRITVDQYHQMIEAEIFHPEDRVELLDGIIVAKHAPSRENGWAPDGHELPVYRLSVDQYHEMIDAGILTTEDRAELLDGFLAAKMSKNTPHIASNRRLRRVLDAALPDGWFLDSQEPITTLSSEPEPDATVVRGTMDDFDNRRVQPADIGLVVEISDTSLRRDRTTKLEIYAQAMLPWYWILNIKDRQLEVRSEPDGRGFARLETYLENDQVPLILDGVEVARIPVRDLLP